MLFFLALTACDDNTAETPETPEPPAEVVKPEPPRPPVTTPPEPTAEPIPEALIPPASHEASPATYTIKWETTKGDFTTTCTRAWSPNGADRLHHLVGAGFYEDIAVFRVIDGFMAQFGLHGNPAVTKTWKEATIDDDPGTQSNKAGYLTFATSGANTRTTQLFINFSNNARLDSSGFTPVCKIDGKGMDVVNALYKDYGEGAPKGRGPNQGMIHKRGNEYLKEAFPELDYITKASLQ
ncbi:MAG: peptidyl-prolyl cis-trans isomerase A (cyclophilin A) [Myxococcota bacterium]|jgi:peptidyl-prolyl cis-trans isomerase A (cyclophilin A)